MPRDELVTDHALIRYLERIVGMKDYLDDIRESLLTDTVLNFIGRFGAGNGSGPGTVRVKIPNADCRVTIKGGRIVTVDELKNPAAMRKSKLRIDNVPERT